MTKKDFETVYDCLKSDMAWLENELYKRSDRNEHAKLLDLLGDCRKGHTCGCNKKTEKMCKELEETLNIDFNYLKWEVIWKIEQRLKNMPFYLKEARKKKKKEAKKCSECGGSNDEK